MILVTGANGVVGAPLVERLQRQGMPFRSVSRSPNADQHRWNLDRPLSNAEFEQLRGCTELIHCAPIWLLAPHIQQLKALGIQRLVVFSSTSVISKQGSASPQEQALVKSLSEAEQIIQAQCQTQEITFTILRPSLIYGYQRDQNVTHIARFIKKWRFALLVGQASGKRQPVHADDLVWCAIECLKSLPAANRVYTVAGGQVLSYKEMVTAVFEGLGRPVRIVKAPLFLFRLLLRAMKIIGRFDYTAEMANRMNQDLSYSNEAATADFGYAPQRFLERPSRDLP